MVKGVDNGVRQLTAIEMDDLNSGVFRKRHIKGVAPQFEGTFKALLHVMSLQDKKEREKATKETMQVARTHSQPSSSQPSEPTTPDRPTYPIDPDFTSLSVESKDEENMRQLLLEFLSNAMSVLEEGFQNIAWQQSGHHVEIAET